MKTLIHFLSIIHSGILLAACGSTTPLQILQPAEMSIPDHIEVIATVDRSKPEKGWLGVLEGAVTGENIGQDPAGRRSAVDGLNNALTRTPRFTVKTTGIELTGSKDGGHMAAPLPWSEIESICSRYDADAVVTIEHYDSDNMLSTRTSTEKSKDKDGKEIIRQVFNTDRRVSVTMGWRLYDPKNRVIMDEHVTRQETNNSGRGYSEQAALNDLPDQERIVRDVSYQAGVVYGMRIAPVWVNVNRTFYKKGKGKNNATSQMEKAGRHAQSGEWDKAAEIWRAISQNAPDEKTGGMAAINMAVANEREGKLNYALEWAQKAYSQFGFKPARNYIRTLEQRINDQNKLNMQLKRP